jgi:zinc protease
LPTTERENCRFRIPHVKGDLKKWLTGTDPKSNVTIMFYGDAKYSAKDAMSMQALGEVLTIKLIEQLRENESGVYGVSARHYE